MNLCAPTLAISVERSEGGFPLPGTGEGALSKEAIIEKWVGTPEGFAAENIEYKVNFVVPKNFGVPGAIIVKNEHPNEFLLVSFSITLPDNSVAHYVTDSWVYNTKDTGGRIFFRNKVRSVL